MSKEGLLCIDVDTDIDRNVGTSFHIHISSEFSDLINVRLSATPCGILTNPQTRKKDNLPFPATWMEFNGIMLSEIRQVLHGLLGVCRI